MNKSTQTTPTWTRFVLVALCVAAVVVAVSLVGAPSQATEVTQRIITAQKGVVQSTVSGDGTLQPVTQDDVNFNTSGTLEHLYVSAGQQVTQGQLLASLNRQSADVGLQQANAALASAQASLTQAEAAQADADTTSTADATESTASVADIAYTARTAADGTTGPTGADAPTGSAPAGSGPGEQTVVTRTTTVTEQAPGGSTRGRAT